MTRLLAMLLLLSLPAQGETPGTGRFRLYLSLDSGWHRHELQVRSYGAGGAKGFVLIDRGIGPEARTPSADEKVHRLPFTADEDPATGALTFTVTAGTLRPQTYSFELYPMQEPERFVWVGTVRVDQGKCGVLAAPLEATSAEPAEGREQEARQQR